jgi:hypothetical protein
MGTANGTAIVGDSSDEDYEDDDNDVDTIMLGAPMALPLSSFALSSN